MLPITYRSPIWIFNQRGGYGNSSTVKLRTKSPESSVHCSDYVDHRAGVHWWRTVCSYASRNVATWICFKAQIYFRVYAYAYYFRCSESLNWAHRRFLQLFANICIVRQIHGFKISELTDLFQTEIGLNKFLMKTGFISCMPRFSTSYTSRVGLEWLREDTRLRQSQTRLTYTQPFGPE